MSEDACLPRCPRRLLKVIAALDVNAERYRSGMGLSWCNRWVADVTAEILGADAVPFRLANEQLAWLSGLDAAAHGWELVTPLEAVVATSLGEVVVVGWRNPDGHGHVAIGVPAPGDVLHIAQAGLRNFASKPVSSGFGSHPVEIYRHR